MGKRKKNKSKHKMSKWRVHIPIFGQRGLKKVDIGYANIDQQSTSALENHKDIFLPSSKALIYASELAYIAKCIQDYPNIETGGQLYGGWTASGAPRVVYAIGPGPKANHEGTFFNQDVNYLEAVGAKLKQYGLQHIGEWHSHHHLGLPCPSGHDTSTMQNSIDQLNLHRLLLCIGSFDSKDRIAINPFNFARDAQYKEARWEVINADNRLRQVIDADLQDLLIHPSSINYIFAESYIPATVQSVSNNNGWFSFKENRIVLKQIIDRLKAQGWVKEVTPQISDEGTVSLKVRSNSFVEILTFPTDFPDSPFSIEHMNLIEGDCYKDLPQAWEIAENDLYKTFIRNYNNHLLKFSK